MPVPARRKVYHGQDWSFSKSMTPTGREKLHSNISGVVSLDFGVLAFLRVRSPPSHLAFCQGDEQTCSQSLLSDPVGRTTPRAFLTKGTAAVYAPLQLNPNSCRVLLPQGRCFHSLLLKNRESNPCSSDSAQFLCESQEREAPQVSPSGDNQFSSLPSPIRTPLP